MGSNTFNNRKKRKKIDFETIIYLFILIVFVGGFTYAYFTNKYELKLLDKYGVTTQGKIFDKKHTKRGYWYKYSFKVNKKSYIDIFRSYKYIEIGDYFETVYYPKNPEISKINLQKKIE